MVEAGHAGLDVDVLVGLVGAGEDGVEVELEVLKVGDELVNLKVLDLDAREDELRKINRVSVTGSGEKWI